MTAAPDVARIFLSYARKDGEAFAADLRLRLEQTEPALSIWQDRARMEGGVGWWKQITDALDHVEYLVSVMTPAAIVSNNTRKEWQYARQQGVCIYPVKGAPHLDYDALPRWMRKAHFYDLDLEWDTFLAHLRRGCSAPRVPFMADDIAPGYVDRGVLADTLSHLVDEQGSTRPGVVVLLGPGGYGKTTVATALCHQDEVISAFDDGILWATLGEKPDVQDGLTKLYAALTGDRPSFVDAEDAAAAFAERLADRSCLIVVDDVWDPSQLRWFTRGGPGCTRLVTTRRFDIAADATAVAVEEMTGREATAILTAKVSEADAKRLPFPALAERLGDCALALSLASAALRQRLARGDTVEAALAHLNALLDEYGIAAFDQRWTSDRHLAISKTIDVSLALLEPAERDRCFDLGAFAPDVEIPFDVVAALWSLNPLKTERQLELLGTLSLVRLDLGRGVIRIHDLIGAYLSSQPRDEDHRRLGHRRLLEAWGSSSDLPNVYAWRWIGYHANAAGRTDHLRTLLFDPSWLRKRIEIVGIGRVIDDFDYLDGPAATIAKGTLRLSALALTRDPSELASQLHGRLDDTDGDEITQLRDRAAAAMRTPWLRPEAASFERHGGHLIRMLPGQAFARAIRFIGDGSHAVSVGEDGSFVEWDLDAGVALRTMQTGAQTYYVALSPDGRRAITAPWKFDSSDEDAQTGMTVWDLEGDTPRPLTNNTGSVRNIRPVSGGGAAVVSYDDDALEVRSFADGRTLSTGAPPILPLLAQNVHPHLLALLQDDATTFSYDLTEDLDERFNDIVVTDGRRCVCRNAYEIQVWDADSGGLLRTITGMPEHVDEMIVSGDGRTVATYSLLEAVTSVWNVETGDFISLTTGSVSAAALNVDGSQLLTVNENSISVWNLTARPASKRAQHRLDVSALALSADGATLLSASDDQTIRLWEAATGREGLVLAGHTGAVSDIAIGADSRWCLSASADRTIKSWDLRTGAETGTLTGHRGSVTSVAILPDQRRAISGSADGTVRLWDLAEARQIAESELADDKEFGTDAQVAPLVVSPSGRRATAIFTGDLIDFDKCDWRLAQLRIARFGKPHIVVRAVVDPGPAPVLALFGDGRTAVSLDPLQDVMIVWTLGTRKTPQRIPMACEGITALAVATDDRSVLVGRQTGEVESWDLASSTPRFAVKPHAGEVTTIVPHPDGRHIATASADATVTVLRADDGAVVATLHGDSAFTACIALPADEGRVRFALGDESGRVHFVALS